MSQTKSKLKGLLLRGFGVSHGYFMIFY